MLLAKQPVQGIIWNQLLDSQPHAYPTAACSTPQDRPKPILGLLAIVQAPDTWSDIEAVTS